MSGKAPGGTRQRLADILPLASPMIVEVFPIYACNFKCVYCVLSLPAEERGFISDKRSLDFDHYKKCIDQIALFPSRLKVLRFSGIGEPLLHKDITGMIQYAAEKKVAEKIELLTNASLLEPKISDALVSAGLSRMVVSLQGVRKEKYREISQVEIDFEAFIKKLEYFYTHRKETHVYIKVVDDAISQEGDEEIFKKVFGSMCDSFAIEHVVPIQEQIDYTHVLGAKGKTVTQFGLSLGEASICPQPFFKLHILPDGKIVPCHAYTYPAIMGDSMKATLSEIWDGEVYKSFRRAMLEGVKCASKVCARCNIFKYRLFPEDILDHDVERLKKYYE